MLPALYIAHEIYIKYGCFIISDDCYIYNNNNNSIESVLDIDILLLVRYEKV